MAIVTVLTGNHLCNNPRVIKEATTLSAAGHAVTVLGAWTDPLLKQRDQHLVKHLDLTFKPVVDWTTDAPARLAAGVRTQLGNMVHRRLRIENRWQLGLTVSGLRRAARESDPDLVIAHSEPALAAVSSLPPVRPALAVDMEDWFSEDLLPEARRTRPLRMLSGMEKAALSRVAYSSCPSDAMSRALTEAYGCVPPQVVYNAFSWAERSAMDGLLCDRATRKSASIHWFSQTVGPGRGLEDLLTALPFIEGTPEIHLRGEPVEGFDGWLVERTPAAWRDRVHVHDVVPNDEILSRIAEHDIGFAGEMQFCRSRDLTVTNKILHYLLGGLAVVASDTAGQREVAAKAPGAVSLYPSGDARALADRINALLRNPARMEAAKKAALSAAHDVFCWEEQAPVLLEAVEAALA